MFDMSWVGADGCWLRNCNSWCVLVSCLLNTLQWCSRCPKEMCAVMIQECHVRYAFRTGWKMTYSPNSLPDEVVMVIMNGVLQWRLVLIYVQWCWISNACWLIIEVYGRYICRVVDVSPSSAKLCIYIPEFYGWFQDDILHITGSYFSSGLVFNMQEMSVVLNILASMASRWGPSYQAVCS